MKTIWKFSIQVEDFIEIAMPVGAEVLTVQMQGGYPYVWAEVETDAKFESRRFRVFGTGHPIPNNFKGRYVDTFQAHNGALVWHL